MAKRRAGGILDRIFLDRVSRTGRVAYGVGQIVLLGALIAFLLTSTDLSFDDDSFVWIFIGGAIPIIIVWGVVCIFVWPRPPLSDIWGRINDAAGKPVPGAEVTAMPDAGGQNSDPAISGFQGEFRLEGLELGTYSVQVTREGYQGTNQDVKLSPDGAAVDLTLKPLQG